MTDDVKPPRRYRSARRLQQARETRRAILDAAHFLFVEQGWKRTTIAAIAREGSVSTESVYAVFGSKRAILLEVISVAVRGEAPETPLLQQPLPTAIRAESNQRRQIALFTAAIAEVLDRVAPLMAVVRSAAESERDIADLYAELHRGRRRNLLSLAESLTLRGRLRNGMTAQEATAMVWRLASPELFVLMTRIEGLTIASYRAWLERSLTLLLLPDGPEPRDG